MSPIMINLLVLLGTAFLALAATLPIPPVNSTLSVSDAPAQGGGFVKNCLTHNVGEKGDLIGRLTGLCSDDENFDDLHITWIDLNECLGNNNGKLAWQEKGALMKSCINCSSRQFDTQWITCECMNATGSWFISSLDLNDGIRYNQQWHVLACYNTRGALDD